MNEISREVWIDAPRKEVWAVLADFGNVYLTNPNILASALTSEQTSGVGTTRHCDLALFGATLEERIVGWDEERSLEIDIYDWEKLPGIKTQRAAFTLQDEGDGTRLRGTVHYAMKYGPVGALLNSVMFRPRSTKGWEIFMGGIKHYVETGERVDKSVRVDLMPVTAVV